MKTIGSVDGLEIKTFCVGEKTYYRIEDEFSSIDIDEGQFHIICIIVKDYILKKPNILLEDV